MLLGNINTARVIVDRLQSIEPTEHHILARFTKDDSQLFSDALAGIEYQSAPGLGSIKNFSTADSVVRLMCQIPENDLGANFPRCHVLIKR